MKKILTVACICLIAMVSFVACTNPFAPTGPELIQLDAPVVVLDENVASWDAVENAVEYELNINGVSENLNVTSIELSDGQTLKVRAVGDGETYSTSAWSNSVTYTASSGPVEPEEPTEPEEPIEPENPIEPQPPVVLEVPTVSISEAGIATWEEVENAIGYKYVINGGEEVLTDKLFVQLYDEDSIVVKAVGNETEFLDSEYSESKTYNETEIEAPPVLQPLPTPTVSLGTKGLASWLYISHSKGYKYKLQDGVEHTINGTSFQLKDGDVFRVCAIADGVNYANSAYSEAIQYTVPVDPDDTRPTLPLPVVTINEYGMATWTAHANADCFNIKINGEIISTGLMTFKWGLINGQSISICALDSTGAYKSSAYTETKVFSKPVSNNPTKLATPTITFKNDSYYEPTYAYWTEVKNATYYIICLNGYQEMEARGSRIAVSDGDTIKVKAVGNGADFMDSDWSATKKYGTAPTPTPPVKEPEKLSAPSLYISSTGLVSWSATYMASYYKYQINNGSIQTTTKTEVQLERGQTVKVQAIGDGTKYLDSDWSKEVTFAENIPARNTPKLLIFTDGLVIWGAVRGQSSIQYLAEINGNELVTLTSKGIHLVDGDKLRVKALGDGVAYIDSEWSSELVYNAPDKPTATYEEVKIELQEILKDKVQALYSVGKISNVKVKDILTNGIITLSYNYRGELYYTKVKLEGVEHCKTFKEVINLARVETNLGEIGDPTKAISMEETYTIISKTLEREEVVELKDVSLADIVWAYATESAAGGIIVNVCIKDGTHISYSISVGILSELEIVKNAYLNNGEYDISSSIPFDYSRIEPDLKTGTYQDIIDIISLNITPHIQNCKILGAIADGEIVEILSNGRILCTYGMGTTIQYAEFVINGLADAKTYDEAVRIALSTRNYSKTLENATSLSTEEQADDVIKMCFENDNVSVLKGYSFNDVKWVGVHKTSGLSFNVQVVMTDHVYISFDVGLSYFTSSPIEYYLNGNTHTINDEVKNYVNIEDKLN